MQQSRAVVRRVASQFAFFRAFFPGMILVSLFYFPSIVALAVTDGGYGRTTLRIATWVFVTVIVVTLCAYLAARLRPRLARKEIERFIQTKQHEISIYEDFVARWSERLANHEQAQLELIQETWDGSIAEARQQTLTYMRQLRDDCVERADRMSREEKLRNHNALVEMYALLREGEENIRQLQEETLPDMPEDYLKSMQSSLQSTFENRRRDLENRVADLTGKLTAAREATIEARRFL